MLNFLGVQIGPLMCLIDHLIKAQKDAIDPTGYQYGLHVSIHNRASMIESIKFVFDATTCRNYQIRKFRISNLIIIGPYGSSPSSLSPSSKPYPVSFAFDQSYPIYFREAI